MVWIDLSKDKEQVMKELKIKKKEKGEYPSSLWKKRARIYRIYFMRLAPK